MIWSVKFIALQLFLLFWWMWNSVSSRIRSCLEFFPHMQSAVFVNEEYELSSTFPKVFFYFKMIIMIGWIVGTAGTAGIVVTCFKPQIPRKRGFVSKIVLATLFNRSIVVSCRSLSILSFFGWSIARNCWLKLSFFGDYSTVDNPRLL